MKGNAMILTSRFDQAIHYTTLIHAGQTRKGTSIPYLSHLLGVTSIVLEHGQSEDEAIGALLHDAGEDAGGDGRIADIRCRFGDAVADIVQGCTDAVVIPKPPWRQRKEDYIAHVRHAPASVRLVSAADKLHNARSILRDYRQLGENLWSRFNGGKEGTLWYYRALTDAFRAAGSNELIDELDRTVRELERLTKPGS
jgi:(p)ppGpp synthase/HD superfamily hydrolase